MVDETLEPLDLESVRAGDIVGIGVHTGNALRGYEIGTAARARGATVVFEATADVAERAEVAFAQFVMSTPYPGTVDFERWEKKVGDDVARVAGIPITRHWLIPQAQRPKLYAPHPTMTPDEIRGRTQAVWDRFYSLRRIWIRSRCAPTLRARLAFVLISKLYRQMYANTGIATDSAR